MDSLVLEHIQVNKALKMPHRIYRAHGWINPTCALPATLILTEGRLFLNQKRRVAQKKKISWKKLKKQKPYGLGVNVASNKC